MPNFERDFGEQLTTNISKIDYSNEVFNEFGGLPRMISQDNELVGKIVNGYHTAC